MMTDPIADLLTRIRNAYSVKKEDVSAPYSKFKETVIKLLVSEGYIAEYTVTGEGIKKEIKIKLRYANGQAALVGIKRMSKPGLKQYVNAKELPKVLSGLGIAVISTSKGLLTDREARKQNLGGEVVAFVW